MNIYNKYKVINEISDDKDLSSESDTPILKFLTFGFFIGFIYAFYLF